MDDKISKHPGIVCLEKDVDLKCLIRWYKLICGKTIKENQLQRVLR